MLIDIAQRLWQLISRCQSAEDLQECNKAASELICSLQGPILSLADSYSLEAANILSDPEFMQLLLQSYGHSLQLLAEHTASTATTAAAAAESSPGTAAPNSKSIYCLWKLSSTVVRVIAVTTEEPNAATCAQLVPAIETSGECLAARNWTHRLVRWYPTAVTVFCALQQPHNPS
jgi:hypothetical protein